MVVYDTDDPEQAAALETRMEQDHLLERNLVQTFGPDTLVEAANRGFRAYDKRAARSRAPSRVSE